MEKHVADWKWRLEPSGEKVANNLYFKDITFTRNKVKKGGFMRTKQVDVIILNAYHDFGPPGQTCNGFAKKVIEIHFPNQQNGSLGNAISA